MPWGFALLKVRPSSDRRGARGERVDPPPPPSSSACAFFSHLLQTAELEMARDGLTTLQETVAAYEATISDKDRELHQLQDLGSTLNATVRECIGV